MADEMETRATEPEEGAESRDRRTYIAAAGGIGLVAVLLLALIAYRSCVFTGCPDVSGLTSWEPAQASVVLDSEGGELARLYEKRKTVVSLDSLPPYVPAAFIAMEDRRFFEHGGVDWIRVVGALRSNLAAGGVREGGSTISMQLARTLFPEQLPAQERSLIRKIREVRVARMIEGVLDKERILELYLNEIYFGEGAYGVQAAAREYFGVPAAGLSLAQAATLAAMPRAPALYDPREHPDAARDGRNMVLRLMASMGYIPPAAAAASSTAAIAAVAPPAESQRAPWFVEEVRQQLGRELGSELYTAGYTIHTTLDPTAQQALEEELEQQAHALEEGRFGALAADGDTLQQAGVIMDPRTGDVLAMVGGRDFDVSRFNRATQAKRQPGSAFKPVVFAAALAEGYSPMETISDEPIEIETWEGDTWRPRNYSGDNVTAVTLRTALARSRNVATVRLAREVGIDRVARLAERLGIAAEVPPYPSLPLGTVETTLLDLTAAYSAFATLGRRPTPRLVTRIEDRHGRVVWEAPAPAPAPVIDEVTAFLTMDLMRAVVDGGTGWRVRRAGFWGGAAGKTGTTQHGADLWFTGFTPTRAATLWFGFDEPRTIVPGGTGGEIVAPVWGRVMRRLGEAAEANWEVPAGLSRVRVDARGIVLEEGCPGLQPVRTVWVRRGDAPSVGQCPPILWPRNWRGGESAPPPAAPAGRPRR